MGVGEGGDMDGREKDGKRDRSGRKNERQRDRDGREREREREGSRLVKIKNRKGKNLLNGCFKNNPQKDKQSKNEVKRKR